MVFYLSVNTIALVLFSKFISILFILCNNSLSIVNLTSLIPIFLIFYHAPSLIFFYVNIIFPFFLPLFILIQILNIFIILSLKKFLPNFSFSLFCLSLISLYYIISLYSYTICNTDILYVIQIYYM